MQMKRYVISVWVDQKGRMHQNAGTVLAASVAEAKAKFMATHSDCKAVTGVHEQ